MNEVRRATEYLPGGSPTNISGTTRTVVGSDPRGGGATYDRVRWLVSVPLVREAISTLVHESEL